jgi:hypothetical protein
MNPNTRTEPARDLVRRAVEAELLIEEKDGLESVLCWAVGGDRLHAVSKNAGFRLLYQAMLGDVGRRTIGEREGLRKSVVISRLLELMLEENGLHQNNRNGEGFSCDSARLSELSNVTAQKEQRFSKKEEVKQYLEQAITNHVVTLFWKNQQPELHLVKSKRVAGEFELLRQIMSDERIAGRVTPNGGIPREVVALRLRNHNGQSAKSKNATVQPERSFLVPKDQPRGKLQDSDCPGVPSNLYPRLAKKKQRSFVPVSVHSIVIAVVAFVAGISLARLCSSSCNFVCRVVLPTSSCPKSSFPCSHQRNETNDEVRQKGFVSANLGVLSVFRPGYIMPVKHPHNAEIIADELDLHVRDWCSVVLDFPSAKSLGLAAATYSTYSYNSDYRKRIRAY